MRAEGRCRRLHARLLLPSLDRGDERCGYGEIPARVAFAAFVAACAVHAADDATDATVAADAAAAAAAAAVAAAAAAVAAMRRHRWRCNGLVPFRLFVLRLLPRSLRPGLR